MQHKTWSDGTTTSRAPVNSGSPDADFKKQPIDGQAANQDGFLLFGGGEVRGNGGFHLGYRFRNRSLKI